MTSTPPDAPRRSPGFNGLVVLGVILLFLVIGVFVWMRWSDDSGSAADEANAALVQPAELPPPDVGAEPARPGTSGTGDAVAPRDARGLGPGGGQPVR